MEHTQSVKDAMADAETLRLVAFEANENGQYSDPSPAARRVRAGLRKASCFNSSLNGVISRTSKRFGGLPVSAFAAHFAFRAVPGLRG